MLINLIQESFKDRQMPEIPYANSKELSHSEEESVNQLATQNRYDLSGQFLEQNYDVICWLSPEAFCYYLPGIINTSIVKEPNLVIISNLLYMLDMSPDVNSWDNFFTERWLALSIKELQAIQEWLIWLNDSNYEPMAHNTLDRAYDTINLIITTKKW